MAGKVPLLLCVDTLLRSRQHCVWVYLFVRLNVWCIDKKMKILLTLFPADVESVLVMLLPLEFRTIAISLLKNCSVINCTRYKACIYPLKLSGSEWWRRGYGVKVFINLHEYISAVCDAYPTVN